MAEWSSFFNSQLGDRVYTSSDFAQYFASFIGNGVMFGGSFLKVNKVYGMNIEVLPGRAFVNGYYYVNKDMPKEITLYPADSLRPRIDRVVLRLDLTQQIRSITATVKTGIAADIPLPPELQRDNEAWEIALADIRINAGAYEIFTSNITDLRLSPDYCGIVTGVIEQPDFSQAFDRYIDRYNQVEAEWAKMSGNWNTFTAGCEKGWNLTLAGMQNEWESFRNAYNGWFNQIKAELFAQGNTDFYDWSRHVGYNLVTTFFENGSINEQLVNRLNSTVLAKKKTEFSSDGSITETLTFNEPELLVSKVTTFGGSVITEAYI